MLVSGPRYDAVVHALFLGFVMTMIFAHAPVILPGVLDLPMAWRPRFYIHVVALHATLAARLGGDLLDAPAVRRWAALLNALALLGFLASTAAAVVQGSRDRTERAPDR